MRTYIKCILTSADGAVSYEGNGATEEASAEDALKVARRKNKKAALGDFAAVYHPIGPVEQSNV